MLTSDLEGLNFDHQLIKITLEPIGVIVYVHEHLRALVRGL